MKISLKKKKLNSGRISLYLEYYNGYSIDDNGKTVHDRSFEYLKLYLHGNPVSSKEKNDNKEVFTLAKNILTLKKAELIKGKFNIEDNQKGKTLLLDYYKKLQEDRYDSKGNYDNWEAAFKYLERYCPANLSIKDIDKNFLKGFKKYLHKEARTSGDHHYHKTQNILTSINCVRY